MLQFSLRKSEVEDQIDPYAMFLRATWRMYWCISNNGGRKRMEKEGKKRSGAQFIPCEFAHYCLSGYLTPAKAGASRI